MPMRKILRLCVRMVRAVCDTRMIKIKDGRRGKVRFDLDTRLVSLRLSYAYAVAITIVIDAIGGEYGPTGEERPVPRPNSAGVGRSRRCNNLPQSDMPYVHPIDNARCGIPSAGRPVK